MQVNPYLFYNGNCEAALKYYQKVLGAKIEAMLPYESGPADMPIPPDWKKKIMHAQDHDRRRGADGVRRAARPFPQAAGIFGLAAGRGSRRCRAQVQGAGRRRQRQHAVRQDFLLQGIRHVRRPVRHALDGQLPDGRHVLDRSRVASSPPFGTMVDALACPPCSTHGTRIDRREFAPAQQQQPRRQSAAAADPVPHRRGIGLQHRWRLPARHRSGRAGRSSARRGIRAPRAASRRCDRSAPCSAPACRPTGRARRSRPSNT